MIIDTHTHVVSDDEDHFPMTCATSDPSDPSSWPVFARVTAETLAEEMTRCGVARACLVQGYAAYQFDNRYTLTAAEKDPNRFVSICAVDTEDPLAPDQLETLATRSRMRGVRLVSGFMEGDPGLGGAGAQRVWETADRLGLIVVAFTLGDQLSSLGAAAAQHAARPVVLDHCGFVDLEQDSERLAELIPLENVFLKVSTRSLIDTEPAAALRRLADRFGAERLLWGSDYPASHERPYQDWVDLARAATANLTSSEADHFLCGTALHLWPELR